MASELLYGALSLTVSISFWQSVNNITVLSTPAAPLLSTTWGATPPEGQCLSFFSLATFEASLPPNVTDWTASFCFTWKAASLCLVTSPWTLNFSHCIQTHRGCSSYTATELFGCVQEMQLKVTHKTKKREKEVSTLLIHFKTIHG